MSLFTSARFVRRVATTSLMAFIMFVAVTALQAAPADACTEAEMRAQSESNGVLWFGAGCLLGPLGVLGSYVIMPNPPASMMIGKSAEYVAQYSDCYKEKSVSLQSKNAWWGCGVTGAVYIAYYALVMAAFSSM